MKQDGRSRPFLTYTASVSFRLLGAFLAVAIGALFVFQGLRFQAFHPAFDLAFVLLGLIAAGLFAHGAARQAFRITLLGDGSLRFTSLTSRLTVPVSDLRSMRLAAGDDERVPDFGACEFRWQGGHVRTWAIDRLDELALHLLGLNPHLRVIDERGVFPTGYLAGNAWLLSPPGCYTPLPAATGKATVVLTSARREEQVVYPGQTEIRFPEAGLSFSSRSTRPATFAGGGATYESIGQVNGVGDFGCAVTVAPAGGSSGDGQAGLRIRIWDRATRETLYDTQCGQPTAAPSLMIGGGAITVEPHEPW